MSLQVFSYSQFSHLSAEGSTEAAVERQHAVVLHHVHRHADHPHLHLLLRLQVHLFNDIIGYIITIKRKNSEEYTPSSLEKHTEDKTTHTLMFGLTVESRSDHFYNSGNSVHQHRESSYYVSVD